MNKLLLIILSALLCLAPCEAQQKGNSTRKATVRRTTTARKAPARKATTTKKQTKAKKTAGKGNASASQSISGLRNEQAKIKQTIRKQEQALRANKAQVQKKLKDLERISSDMILRQRSIDSINSDLHRLDDNIGLLSSQLENLQKQLEERKASYVKSMRYMAKQRNIQSQLMFIFSAKSLTETFRRMRFMRQYAAYQRTQGKAVQEKQRQMDEKRKQLHATRGQKSTMLTKGHREQQALMQQKDEQQKLVNSLQKQQKTIAAVIDEQKKKDATINAQIDKLIAEEVERARQRAIAEAKRKAEQAAAAKRKAEELARKKAEAEARARENARRIAEAKAAEERAKAAARAEARNAEAKARAEQKAREAEAARVAAERKALADKERADRTIAEARRESETTANFSSVDRAQSGHFEANKGRLPSPIAGGRIVSHFGQHGVEGLPGVVLDNKGINILGPKGAVARAIYDGEVSAVFNAGGSWGVLVRHGRYISVYCNLASVSVSKGQQVSVRQALGTVGRDNILQFQLRMERTKLNPEAWIAR